MKQGKSFAMGCALMLSAALLLSGCSADRALLPVPSVIATAAAAQERTTATGFYFDTVVTITLYGAPEGMMDSLLRDCERYEALLSKTVDGSDVSRLNQAEGKPVKVDPETWQIIARAKEISRLTGGAFSITVAPLTALWDFTGGTERMPTEEERLAALPLVDDSAITLGQDGTVCLPAGAMIDLGGIAKGYIADQLAETCREAGVPALLNFGGNVYAEGVKPDGSDWRIGIRDPLNPVGGNPVCIINVKDRTVVTSGTYERFFIKDGIRYHHILNPENGYPAETDLTSATIVGTSSMDADAFATACIVLGESGAFSMLAENGLNALLIDTEGKIKPTENFEYQYQLTISSAN